MTTARFVALLAYSGALVAMALPLREHPTSPPTAPEPSPSLALAAQVLREAQEFSAVQVGFAGSAPPEVLAWRIVLHSDQADGIFQHLIATGGRPGQLYALAGLRFLMQIGRTDSAAYDATVRRLARSRESVRTQIGCIGSSAPLSSLVREVHTGLWTREFIAGRLLDER